MINYPSPLLIIVSSLLSLSSACGDDRIRQAQEELRKRHLFFGETSGEPSPALTAAIGHYQKKKGFACTGLLDPETCGSLRIGHALIPPATPPAVLADTGEARDANGEALPRSIALAMSNEDRTTQFDRVLSDQDHLVLTLLGSDKPIRQEASDSQGRSRGRSRRAAPSKTQNPFVVAFQSVDHAMKRLLGDTAQTKKKSVASKRL
jgi:hypothetical protein